MAGAAAAAAGVLAGELGAGLVSPSLSPVSAVGGAVVDLAPSAAKDWAIAAFGTADKLFLVSVIAAAVVALGAVAGLLELRRRGAGAWLAAGIGAVGLAAVATRAQATPAAWLCALAAGAVAAGLVRWLVARLRPAAPPAVAASALDRRRFFRALAGTAGAIALGGALTAVVRGASLAVTAARDALRLPVPADPAPPVPSAAELRVSGITPLVTPNRDFYRIDTALVVPSVDPGRWRLTVTGKVEEPVTLTWDELLAAPLVERHITLACVSNPVGGDLVGNARWLGWPVRELLARSRPKDGADMVLSRSVDGFTAGTPLEVLTDEGTDALLAVGMNGEPLPPEHGFPVRLVVPGLYGYVSATKWVTELRVTSFAEEKAYWSTRGWSERGPVKTASRIDVPRRGARVPAGVLAVGGVAWAQHRGISAVQVRADDGEWQPARLGTGISRDTWYQWAAEVTLAPGTHRLSVRAVDGTGEVQTGQAAPPAPDGATGHHTITIEAT
ncbi:hypothetical protein GCM10028789_09720 [Sinomonas halotolerans]